MPGVPSVNQLDKVPSHDEIPRSNVPMWLTDVGSPDSANQIGFGGPSSVPTSEGCEVDAGYPVPSLILVAERDRFGVEIRVNRDGRGQFALVIPSLEGGFGSFSQIQSPLGVSEVRFSLTNRFPVATDAGSPHSVLTTGLRFVCNLQNRVITEVPNDVDGLVDVAVDVMDDRHCQNQVEMLDFREESEGILVALVLEDDSSAILLRQFPEIVVIDRPFHHHRDAIEVLHESEGVVAQIGPDVEDREGSIELAGELLDYLVSGFAISDSLGDAFTLDPLVLILFCAGPSPVVVSFHGEGGSLKGV